MSNENNQMDNENDGLMNHESLMDGINRLEIETGELFKQMQEDLNDDQSPNLQLACEYGKRMFTLRIWHGAIEGLDELQAEDEQGTTIDNTDIKPDDPETREALKTVHRRYVDVYAAYLDDDADHDELRGLICECQNSPELEALIGTAFWHLYVSAFEGLLMELERLAERLAVSK